MPRLDEHARGVFPISATPFTDNGEIDWESADRLTDFYLQCGVHGLTLLGMMGEAQKLTLDEASSFAVRAIRRVDGRVPVVVGVSAGGLAPMAELTRRVMGAGAAGVLGAPPAGRGASSPASLACEWASTRFARVSPCGHPRKSERKSAMFACDDDVRSTTPEKPSIGVARRQRRRGTAQSSHFKPATRRNSLTLDVTSVAPRRRA